MNLSVFKAWEISESVLLITVVATLTGENYVQASRSRAINESLGKLSKQILILESLDKLRGKASKDQSDSTGQCQS